MARSLLSRHAPTRAVVRTRRQNVAKNLLLESLTTTRASKAPTAEKMLRYVAAAAALKFASLPPATPVYRKVANQVGARRRVRSRLDPAGAYLVRARRVLDICNEHGLIRDGARILEIGTGWVHWEATVLRLFYDVHATLVDVWDNRQLSAYKAYLRQFVPYIDSEFGVDRARVERAHVLLERVLEAQTFEEVYELTGFTYVIDKEGTLAGFEDESFDLIISSAVLEHVSRKILPTFIGNTARVLTRSGHSFHGIDMGDHLSYLDRKAHKKQYLAYSQRAWSLLFENCVQYFNRVQREEWLSLFERNQLKLVAIDESFTPVTGLRIAPEFLHLSDRDLACTSLRVLHKKAAAAT